MDAINVSVVSAIIAALLWALKVIGDKLISNYFDTKKANEDLKDSMLDERIKWLSTSIDELKRTIKESTQETQKHKIMMQGLSHELSSLRAEFKDGNSHHKETIVRLIEVLKAMQNDIKIQKQEIETIGRVIIRLPESG